MAEDVILAADGQLRALYGHVICVAGQDLQLGADGILTAPAAAADILLQQSGWSRVAPEAAAKDEGDAPADSDAADEPSPKRRGKGQA